MRRKIISLIGLLLIALFAVSMASSRRGLVEAADKPAAFNIANELELSVGEEVEFSFMPYVPANTEFTYTVSDENIVYVTSTLNKLMALRAGNATVRAESDSFCSEFTVTVKLEDMNPDSKFNSITAGSRWTASNQTIDGWRLYTGGAAVGSDQVVELYTDESGDNMIHFNHPTQYYANLYKDLTGLPAGEYYVTVDMMGNNVANTNCFVRLNLNNQYGQTTTERLSGTFGWGTLTSPIFRIADGESLRLELYFANNIGEVFFDNLHVYRVITLDHTAFMVGNSVENLVVGNTAQITCETVPASTVDFEYTYESSNPEVATVSKTGLITAVSNGVSTITVTDVLEGFTREVLVIVGVENGITAVVNNGQAISVAEDSQTKLSVSSEVSENFEVYAYSDPAYGDYYIEDNQIVYSPKADWYSTGNTVDSFEILVYDDTQGYCVVPVEVTVLPEADEIQVIDYWHSVEKNGVLDWGSQDGLYDHSILDAEGNRVFGGGYIQVQSYDVEVLYPQTANGSKGSNATEQQAYRQAKAALYSSIIGTNLDGSSLTITTENGGTVEILYNGAAREIQDRYYSSQGNIVYGIIYKYTPAENFVGYDHFDMLIKNGDEQVTFTNTVYVLPAVEDFNFDALDYDGVYLLSNDEWLEEVREGYESGDPYITEWVEYYEASYAIYVPTGVPADSRTAMEQLAILYQVTGDSKYFDMCWEQMYEVVKDESVTTDNTRRQSWGRDSNGFLDAAMVTYSVAFAYNYIKENLTPEQQTLVIKALYEEGFYWFENLNNVNVLLHGNNHNLLVCGNLAVAALSAMSYEGSITVSIDGNELVVDVREMAAETVMVAFEYLQIGLVHYSESGGFPEGPSYSIYAHRNMVNLIATLYNLYGADESGDINSFGLWDIEGIKNYINYPLYTSTPNYESFYYAESDYSNNQPALLWYTRIDEDNVNAAVLPLLAHQNEQYNIQNLLWYQPGLFDKVDLHNMEDKDMLLEAHELATFRTEFGDEMGLFTGLKGVDDYTNNYSHKNLDSGTFEIYALGERFIGNYSNETYNTVVPDGYWDYDYQRWTYYKKGAQGQNTLVINPDQEPVLTQDPDERAQITRFEYNSSSGIATIDLSRVYKAEALSVTRGLKVFNDRQYVMVQDEFNLRGVSTLYWSAHTEARIDLLTDKLARLTLNGKVMYAYIVSEMGTFTKMSGNTPLPGTIGNFCNLDNTGVSKLVIELTNITSGTLCVVFIPTLEEVSDFSSYKVTPLADWELDAESTKADIVAEDITFDLDINNDLGRGYVYTYNPYQYTYVVELARGTTEVPDFVVTYDETKYDVEINKSDIITDFSTVTLTDKTTGESVTYRYKFIANVLNDAGQFASYTQIPVASVSGHANAANLIDNQNGTSLVSTNMEEIVFEFADVEEITDVLIRFNGGVRNTYYFDIYYSQDGVNYTCAYFGGQNQNSIGDEVHALGKLNAKYIKIVFHGNNNDDQTQVAEVKFYNNGLSSNGGQTTTPDNGNNNTNGGNNTLWIVLGVVGGLVVAGAAATIVIVLRRRKKQND